MAAKRSLQLCSTSVRNVFFRRTKLVSEAANTMLFGQSPSKPCRFTLPNCTSSWIPVELGGALRLMPLHSVTASALLTSLLSLHSTKWGSLSEGFATPL